VGRLQRHPKAGWVVLDLDECHARLYPTVSHVWAPRGEYPTLPLLDAHGKCVAFAAIDLHTGRTFHHLSRSLAGAEQLRLLEQVVTAYPGQRLLLIWDNGPTHRNKKVAAWLAAHPQVACFWLPPYSGADANPIEHFWRWFRDCVTHNHLFQTVEELFTAAAQFFQDFASNQAAVLSRLGLM
jgi:hypothetical protein